MIVTTAVILVDERGAPDMPRTTHVARMSLEDTAGTVLTHANGSLRVPPQRQRRPLQRGQLLRVVGVTSTLSPVCCCIRSHAIHTVHTIRDIHRHP